MTKPWRGRIEDAALLRGAGRFAADAPMPGEAQAAFVRSPHACARIRMVDRRAALAAPGVLAVLTAADVTALGAGSTFPRLAAMLRSIGRLAASPRMRGRSSASSPRRRMWRASRW
jgi:aerobic carbon-monoxide dehydrogenase large subunit